MSSKENISIEEVTLINTSKSPCRSNCKEKCCLEFEFDNSQSDNSSDDSNDNFQIPDSSNKDQNISQEISYDDNTQILYDLLKLQTNDYTLTYTQVKSRPIFNVPPLSEYNKTEIIQMIKVSRQKIKRQTKQDSLQIKTKKSKNILSKRTFNQSGIDVSDKRQTKKQKKVKILENEIQDFSLPLFVINNLNSFDENIKNKVLKIIDEALIQDQEMLQQVQQKLITTMSKQASDYYEGRNHVELIKLLQSFQPAIAILINIQISILNPNYMEESNTLSQTLLPYLNQVTDYSFLTEESSFLVSRFLKALSNHVVDIKGEVGIGFILCALKIDPSKLNPLMKFKDNLKVLSQALVQSQFSLDVAELISINYQKLLWPELLTFFKGKTDKILKDCIHILIKMDIISDPGNQMNQLIDIFAQRQIIVDNLLKVQVIKLGLPKLIRILETILPLQADTISKCLEADSLTWEASAIQNQNKEDQQEKKLEIGKINEIYGLMTKGCKKLVSIEEINDISLSISNDVEIYKHCLYQAAISAIVISHNAPFTIVISPTGSGKTWIQGIIAKYFCNSGRNVTILEPSYQLKLQTTEKLASVDYGITTLTIEEFYQQGSKDDIIIMNEYDIMIDDYPYMVSNQQLSGVWQFKDKQVIAFSATSSSSYERFVNNCISRPLILKFKSEYELINGTSPIQESIISTCNSRQDIIKQLSQDIDKYYEVKPIIVICDIDQEKELSVMFFKKNYRHLLAIQLEALTEIRQWDYGILILRSNLARGIDVRFQKDSIVLIISDVKTYHQLQQMIGRSSRQRNVCESILYLTSQEKSPAVIERLKKQNIGTLQDLERLIQFFESRQKESTLASFLKIENEKGMLIQSIKQLQTLMAPTTYSKLVKGFSF